MANATQDYILGGGEVYFAQFPTGLTTPGGYRFIGNCSELNLNREIEKKEHFSSTKGIKFKDRSFVTNSKMGGSLITDNIAFENLAYFFGASTSMLTVSAATAVIDNFASIIQGLMYQLGTALTTPAGARNVTNVVVTDSVPTTYVLDTDYTLDAAMGTVTPIVGGGISAGTSIIVTYNVAISTRSQMIAVDQEIEGALRYKSFNQGVERDCFMPQVTLTPNGDMGFITEDWLTIPMTIDVLTLAGYAPLYIDGRAV